MKILFPIDFSELSKKALLQAIDFCKKTDAHLIIFHVYHRPVGKGNAASDKLKLNRTKELVEKGFEKLSNTISELKQVSHEFKKTLGIFDENLVEAVKKENVDLVIMATKGAVGFGELWGTKTAKVIKMIDVPVIILPDRSELQEISKVGLACDYSESTDYASVEFVGRLAEQLKLDVNVVTLNRVEKSMTREELHNREQVLEYLKDVPHSFNFTSHRNIQEGLVDYCKAKNLSMLAILPKSYSFLERLFHDSLTQQMAFQCPVPLLVLK
ncbi:MAG: universal stress protein [Candidatus Cyclobacteriaceae bacterium M2_1C_046]